MTNLSLALAGAWKFLLAGLVLGSGLPAVFGLGIRSLALARGGEAETDGGRPHRVGMFLAGLCFLVVLAAVVLGLLYIIVTGFGKELSFSHLYPMIVDTKK